MKTVNAMKSLTVKLVFMVCASMLRMDLFEVLKGSVLVAEGGGGTRPRRSKSRRVEPFSDTLSRTIKPTNTASMVPSMAKMAFSSTTVSMGG